jgi:RNA 2',3'-cyclic 3'-phosphodiesterase
MRLFFALWPAPDLAEQLAGIARAAAGRFGGKPTRQESIHLTLAFLGELPEAQLPQLLAAAWTVRGQPFVLHLDRFGHWPRKQLLWAGEASPNAALGELVGDLQNALGTAGFALAGRYPVFAPHVTLVRAIPETRELAAPFATIAWPCSSFVLIRSQRSDEGSSYQVVAEFPLRLR